MDQKKCLYCASLMDKDLKFCPNCKRPQGINWTAVIIILALILFLLIIFMARYK